MSLLRRETLDVNAGVADHVVMPSIFFDNLCRGKTERTGPAARRRAAEALERLTRALNDP